MRRSVLISVLGVLSLAGCGGAGSGPSSHAAGPQTANGGVTAATTGSATAGVCIVGIRRGKKICGAAASSFCSRYAPAIFEGENRFIAEGYAGSRHGAEEIVTELRENCLKVGRDLGPVASGKPRPPGTGAP